ncbi:MAG: tetratricopeptide repeat protein [Leptolyngbyaceae cyanobacterium]
MNNRFQRGRLGPIADYALLLGSGAGAVASLATQNAALATVPMTALVAAGLLNRRRIEQLLRQSDAAIADLEGQLISEVSVLTEQVSALPSPESITQLQRSAMAYSDRNITHCIESIDRLQRDFTHRLEALEAPDLSGFQQETTELRDQYTNLCTTVSNLSKQIERFSHAPRLEVTETDVAQLKTEVMQLRVSLESLSSESKTAQATLQDAVRHLDRRLRQMPNGADPNMLKGEVRELIKAVSDLVPRRDFVSLTEKLKAVQDNQEHLQHVVDRLRSGPDGMTSGQVAPTSIEVHQFRTDLAALATGLRQVENRLDDISVPFDITAEIRGTTATYLSGLQWQLSMLEQQTQDLMQQQEAWSAQPHSRLPVPLPPKSDAAAEKPDEGFQWLMSLRSNFQEQGWSAIEQSLSEALDSVSERLVLVWPWTSTVELDARLVDRFTELLAGGCRLEIGWCHPGDRTEGHLLRAIAQQWRLTTMQRRLLKSTLNHLLPLKQKYPELFSFKILGTKEQFIICDHRYAILGLQALPATSSVFPELDLRVKTSDTHIINQLLYRFEHPDMLPEEADAYFNRAVTRYDLRDAEGAVADYAQVLRLQPDDPVALNNRGLIMADKKHYQRAMDDFDQALRRYPHLFAARCNRGWLQMHQGNLNAAIADFSAAIQTSGKQVAIPYFYRGQARQRLDDSLGAIADFSQAIQKSPRAALPYCYRGAVYQRQGDVKRAINDLETAAAIMHAQGDHQALSRVTQALSSLKQAELTQPISLHSA